MWLFDRELNQLKIGCERVWEHFTMILAGAERACTSSDAAQGHAGGAEHGYCQLYTGQVTA